MAEAAQKDVAHLLHANRLLRESHDNWVARAGERAKLIAELEAENEKLKRQFEQLAELTKRAMVMLEQALGR
jgi:hypothetical protein